MSPTAIRDKQYARSALDVAAGGVLALQLAPEGCAASWTGTINGAGYTGAIAAGVIVGFVPTSWELQSIKT
jgi:hypothetical protein